MPQPCIRTSRLQLSIGAVLENAGLLPEGCKRQAFCKVGVFHDLLLFGATCER